MSGSGGKEPLTTWVFSGADQDDVCLGFAENSNGLPGGWGNPLVRIRPEGRCMMVSECEVHAIISLGTSTLTIPQKNQTEIPISLKFVLFLPPWICCGRCRQVPPSTMTATKPCFRLNNLILVTVSSLPETGI